MTDNGSNDRRRAIEGRINTLGTGGNGVSGRESSHESRHSRDSDEESDDVGSTLPETADEDEDGATADVPETDAIGAEDDDAEHGSDEDGTAEETEADGAAGTDDESEAGGDDSVETRAADIDERSSLEIEMDRFVRAFAARRANEVGEDSLDEYIVGSVKGYLAGLLGGDVESPGTLTRAIEVEADDIFGGLLDTIAADDEEPSDVVIAAVTEAYDVPEDDSLVVAGLRDHEALLNGVVANSSNSLSDVSAVVQAAVETRLIEEPAE